MALIVKRKGHKENFESRKIYASVYSACRNVGLHEEEAELVADKVSGQVQAELGQKEEIRAHQIMTTTTHFLREINPDAAFMYETHRDVS